MSHESLRASLDDYVEGTLDVEAHARVEAHLEQCAGCREEVERLGFLLREARALPASLPPPRDLWPEIAPRLQRRSAGSRSLWSVRHYLAAAALVLVVLSSTLTALVLRRSATETERAGAVAAALLEMEARYIGEVSLLEEAARAGVRKVAPETRRLVEENLRIIDEAIQETRAALLSDPGNRDVGEMLASAYEKKIALLEHMTRVSAEL